MIYNPWFTYRDIDAVVVPMGVRMEDYAATLSTLARVSNFHGALVTMPHKVATLELVDEASTAAKIAGACNAIGRRPDGTLFGDQFDGDGFVRAMIHNQQPAAGKRALIVGSGGVGSAIAASLAQNGVSQLKLFDTSRESANGLAGRLREHYPSLDVSIDEPDPTGIDIVVNATPLGMKTDDALPLDPSLLEPQMYVGEVVMTSEMTPFLKAASDSGCRTQVGTDMLFQMIPAYLDFFGFGSPSVQELKLVSEVRY